MDGKLISFKREFISFNLTGQDAQVVYIYSRASRESLLICFFVVVEIQKLVLIICPYFANSSDNRHSYLYCLPMRDF